MNKKEIIKMIEENIGYWLHYNILSEDKKWELDEEGFMEDVKRTLRIIK